MNKGGSVRSMLLWPLLITLSLGFVLLGWFVVRSVEASAIERIEDELVRVGAQEGARDRGLPLPDPPPAVIQGEQAVGAIDRPIVLELSAARVLALRGPVNDRPTDTKLLPLFGRQGFFTVGTQGSSHGFRAFVASGPQSSSVVLIGLEDVANATARLTRSLFIGAIGVFALQALAVWLVTRRIAEPIGAVADAASRIADGELDTQIPTNDRPRETAELADSVGVMVKRLRGTVDTAERSAADATAARDQMQRFLADASHELRTPLTSIGGYAQLHNRGMLDDAELDKAMTRVESESARLSRLVDDMLVLARGNELSFEPRSMELGPLVWGVGEDLRAAYPDRSVNYDLDAAEDVEIHGDRDQLHQAILNLGKNALSHSPSNAEITLAVGVERGQPTVEVIDHGEGISAPDRERIFEPFYRSDESRYRSENQSGAGLGLAITKMICDRHGATLSHAPTPGGGTTFTISLATSNQRTVR